MIRSSYWDICGLVLVRISVIQDVAEIACDAVLCILINFILFSLHAFFALKRIQFGKLFIILTESFIIALLFRRLKILFDRIRCRLFAFFINLIDL